MRCGISDPLVLDRDAAKKQFSDIADRLIWTTNLKIERTVAYCWERFP
jgi:hypothetical protein